MSKAPCSKRSQAECGPKCTWDTSAKSCNAPSNAWLQFRAAHRDLSMKDAAVLYREQKGKSPSPKKAQRDWDFKTSRGVAVAQGRDRSAVKRQQADEWAALFNAPAAAAKPGSPRKSSRDWDYKTSRGVGVGQSRDRSAVAAQQAAERATLFGTMPPAARTPSPRKSAREWNYKGPSGVVRGQGADRSAVMRQQAAEREAMKAKASAPKDSYWASLGFA